MFLSISAETTAWNEKRTACTLVLPTRHPLAGTIVCCVAATDYAHERLADFVELPESCTGLHYSNILCGVIRGALEMVCRVVNVAARTASAAYNLLSCSCKCGSKLPS